MRKPDFFIVGAPRCGTTAMRQYLGQHLDIFMPLKDSNFFGSDINIYFPFLKNKKEYLLWFKKAKANQVIGESSIWYLYSKRAAEEIKRFCPKAKIVIMLRNPIEAIYSLHSRFVLRGHEDIVDFEKALAVEKERRESKRIPKACRMRSMLFYRELGCFSDQVKRYIDVFGKDRVLVIIFDDFKSNPEKIYKKLLGFLGVRSDFVAKFKVINKNRVVRSRTLRNFLVNPNGLFLRVGRQLVPRSMRAFLFDLLLGFNEKSEKRKAMSINLQKKLKKEFAGEVRVLGKLLGRDLSGWIE